MDRDTKESPWAAWGESAKFEDCIIGNRAGLEALRDKISEALQKGAAQLPEKITTCTRVVVVEAPANPEWIPEKHGRLKNAVGLTGCAIIAVAVAAIFIVGLGTIKDWWK